MSYTGKRNKKGEGRQHFCSMILRLTPEEKDRLDYIADAQNLSKSDVLRNYIWAEYERLKSGKFGSNGRK